MLITEKLVHERHHFYKVSLSKFIFMLLLKWKLWCAKDMCQAMGHSGLHPELYYNGNRIKAAVEIKTTSEF